MNETKPTKKQAYSPARAAAQVGNKNAAGRHEGRVRVGEENLVAFATKLQPKTLAFMRRFGSKEQGEDIPLREVIERDMLLVELVDMYAKENGLKYDQDVNNVLP